MIFIKFLTNYLLLFVFYFAIISIHLILLNIINYILYIYMFVLIKRIIAHTLRLIHDQSRFNRINVIEQIKIWILLVSKIEENCTRRINCLVLSLWRKLKAFASARLVSPIRSLVCRSLITLENYIYICKLSRVFFFAFFVFDFFIPVIFVSQTDFAYFMFWLYIYTYIYNK